MDPKDNSKFLSDDERSTLVGKINASTLEKVAAESGASELALAKAAAGIPVQKGTIALARAYVAKVSG